MDDRERGSLVYRFLDRWMRMVARLVPEPRRARWLAEWDAELWYGVRGRAEAPRWRAALGLARGLLNDALAARRNRAVTGAGLGRGDGDGVVDALLGDVRYGLRMLRRGPGFALVVALTLALGIGATVTVFSVVNALLVEPLPYPHSDRLVMLWMGRRAARLDKDWFSGGHFTDIRSGSSAFEELAIVEGGSATLTGRGRARRLGWVRTSSSYLRMLGATAAEGRVLDEHDDEAAATPVAMLTYALWQDAFGADPRAVGRTIGLDGRAYEIVGVLSADLLLNTEVLPVVNGTGQLDVVLSLPLTVNVLNDRLSEGYNIVGRLAPDVSLRQAQEELDGVAADIQRLHETDPDSGFFIRAVPLIEEVVGSVRGPLILLLASVAGVLLIACVNVANLLLARSGARGREMGVRTAIGAERARLVRQLLTESAVLALIGGGLGVGVAVAGLRVVRRVGATSLPRVSEIGVDHRVLLFAVAITALTCFIFGLIPAWRASRIDPVDALRPGAPQAGGPLWSRFSLPSALVAAEIGLSLTLLVASGLLIRSFIALERVDPGFETEGRLTFAVYPGSTDYAGLAARVDYYERLMRRLESVPGVTAVVGASHVPFDRGVSWAPIDIVDYAPPQGEQREIISDFRYTTPGYFAAMGIPLIRGRDFRESDGLGEARVAIIDQSFADTYFPDRDPIGMQLVSWGPVTSTIVGVVGTVRNEALDRGSHVRTYLPVRQEVYGNLYMVLTTSGDPTALITPATRAVAEVDPSVPVRDARTMTERVQASLDERRFSTGLLEVLSAVALVLAAVGVYGLVSYRVSRGARDLGLRMALGASRGRILGHVLRHGAALASVGVASGLAGALALTGLLRSLLFGVDAVDGATYAAVSAGLVLTVLSACYIPARRAAAVDPLEVIKGE